MGMSEIVHVGPVQDVDNLAYHFGCKVGASPMTYLGWLIGLP